MRVVSYHNGEEWMRGKVVAFVKDMAVVQNDANDFLATLNINSLKVIDEHCKNEKDLKSDNFTIQKVNEELMLKIFEKQNEALSELVNHCRDYALAEESFVIAMAVDKANDTIQETKQMIEKLGEEVK